MKLAYFSPLPPAKTGIATYSSELLPALADHFDITVFTPTPAAQVPAQVTAVNFVDDPGVLKSVQTFDHALYHLGNNPYFHLDILRAFLLWPDTVVMHDTVLYFLAAGGGNGALLRELLQSNPTSAFEAVDEIHRGSPDGNVLRYPVPSKYPCLTRVLLAAPQVIVHNQAARHEVEARGYPGVVDVVPLLHYRGADVAFDTDGRSLRLKHGLQEGCVVFGAFGFIGPTKRLDKVFHAFSRVIVEGRLSNARLLVVGEGDSIDELVRERGLEKVVIRIGFVEDGEFRRLLSSVDVVLNLRYPSHGESSATLIQAMMNGKPCLVTDDASFADLPDNTVVKVGHGVTEVDEIAEALIRLAEGRTLRNEIGMAARRHVLANHAPEQVAAQYRQALAQRPPTWRARAARPQLRAVAGAFAARYLEARVRSLLP
jgi:glycosyltransferase involved in cell wall biosynthesis